MASELKVDKFTGVTTAGSILVTGEGGSTTTNLQQGLVKSWVNFNGTSTLAVRDSLNTTSVSDNSTGNYTQNHTNSFSAGDYSGTVAVEQTAHHSELDAINASNINVISRDNSGSGTSDSLIVCISNIGDLA